MEGELATLSYIVSGFFIFRSIGNGGFGQPALMDLVNHNCADSVCGHPQL